MVIVIAASPFTGLVRQLMGSIQLVLPNHPNIMYRYLPSSHIYGRRPTVVLWCSL